MPRGPRLDAPGSLHPIMVRGIERKKIFESERDIQGRLVGKGDFEAQARQVYTNLRNILKEAGGDLKNIVKTTPILTHYGHIESYRKIRNEFFGDIMPPNTLLIIESLASPDFMIEVEGIAVLD